MTPPGRVGSPSPAVMPTSRRANITTPAARKRTAPTPTSATPGQSYWPLSAIRLAGQGAGQCQDRPERGAQREQRAVLPRQVAAECAEPFRLTEEVDHRRGHAADELVDLTACGGRREHGGDRGSEREHEPAEHA